MNALKKLFRAIGALVMLAAILVGLPWLLLRYGNWPITSLPTKEWLRHLNEPVSDSTLYDVLTVAVWCLWAIFSFSILVEFGSQLRGVRAPRISIFGPVQTAARGLVAAVLVTVTIHQGISAAANASPASAFPVGRMPVAEQTVRLERTIAPMRSHGAPTRTSPVARSDTATMNPGGTVTVERGDNAWSIADSRLGDGMRWRELWDLNHGVLQADGRAWIDQQVLLQGWTLRLPGPQVAAGSPAPVTSPAVDSGSHEYVVVRGDNLSEIAKDQLGDEARYREIYDLSRNTDQPGHRHLTDPNLILPGWRLTIPGAAATPTPPAVPSVTDVPSAVEVQPHDPPPAVTTNTVPPVVSVPVSFTSTTSEPALPPATSTAPSTTVASTTPSTLAWPAPPATDKTNHNGTRGPSLPLILGVGSSLVLASGLSVRMALLRKSRIARGLRDNRLIERNAATIRTVVRAADVPLVKWAAHHLSYLILGLEQRSIKAVPEAVELSEEAGIEILWSDKEPNAPHPWRAIDGGAAWRLDYDPDDSTPIADRSAALSALVTIGHREGRQLLIDLEAFGSIAIDGPPDRVDALLRSIAMELAAGDDLANAYIDVVGIAVPGRTLPRLKQTSIAEATSSLESWAHDIGRALADGNAPTAFHFRLGNDFPTEAYVAVVADRESDVVELIATPAGRAVAAVIAGTHHDAGCQIRIAEDGLARVEPLGIVFTTATLQADAEQIIGDTLTELVALLKPPPPADLVETQPDEVTASKASETMEDDNDRMDTVAGSNDDELIGVDTFGSDATTAALPECIRPKLLVKIFGVPCVPARPTMRRREIFTTVVVACHDGPITASLVQDALYADNGIRQKTLNNVIGYTRAALGKFDDGTEIFPDRHQRQLAVAEGVKTDLAVLKEATKLAESMSSAEAIVVLDAAHQLITGPPFDANGYDWAHEKQFYREATDAINDATIALVDCALVGEAIDIARAAVNRAFRAVDVHEPLYRLRMRIEHGAGNLGGSKVAYDELNRHLMDIDMEPSDETVALARELFERRRVMPD